MKIGSMSVTLFGICLAAALACASFVAYWYGWRFAKMMIYSATVNALGATIVYTLSLPKMVSTIVTAVSCIVFFFQFVNCRNELSVAACPCPAVNESRTASASLPLFATHCWAGGTPGGG